MDKRLVLIAIVLMIITGCVKPATLDQNQPVAKNQTTANTTTPSATNKTAPIGKPLNATVTISGSSNQSGENETLVDQTIVDEPAAPEPETPKDRIDVSPGTSDSRVIATINGKTQEFKVPDLDHDAVVFDISQKLSMGIREVRPLVYFNGVPYLKPTELKKAQEKLAQKEVATFNISSIKIIQTKEEGFIRGVGCDLDKKYLRIDGTNYLDTDITIFKNSETFPRVKDALVFSLNRRILENMNCGETQVVQPGKNFTCLKAESIFIGAGSRNAFETNASYDTSQPDTVGVNRPGYRESMTFFCTAGNQTSS